MNYYNLNQYLTVHNKKPDFSLIEKIANQSRMPLCYGGGIKKAIQAKTIFSLGVEKVSIQEPLMDNYNLLKEISHKFGSSSVIASIDVKKNFFGKTKIFNSSNNKIKNKSWENHLRECIESGAGEILLTSVDYEGTRKGFDYELVEIITKKAPTKFLIVVWKDYISQDKNKLNLSNW